MLVRVALCGITHGNTHRNKQAYPHQTENIRHSWSQANSRESQLLTAFVCVCVCLPLNAPVTLTLFWQGLNVRRESPKLEQLAFLFLLSPTKKLILPVFSRLRSKSLHSSSDWPFSSRHRCTHTCLYPLPQTHTHRHPPPTSWVFSLVWVTCTAPPDLGQPPGAPPPLAWPAVIKLQRISGRLQPTTQQPPWPTLDVPQLHMGKTFKRQGRTGENGGEKRWGHDEQHLKFCLHVFQQMRRENGMNCRDRTVIHRVHLDIYSARTHPLPFLCYHTQTG